MWRSSQRNRKHAGDLRVSNDRTASVMSDVVPTSIIAAMPHVGPPIVDFMSCFTRTCRHQRGPLAISMIVKFYINNETDIPAWHAVVWGGRSHSCEGMSLT